MEGVPVGVPEKSPRQGLPAPGKDRLIGLPASSQKRSQLSRQGLEFDNFQPGRRMQPFHEPEVDKRQRQVERTDILGRKPVPALPEDGSEVQGQDQGFYIGALERKKVRPLTNALSDGV